MSLLLALLVAIKTGFGNPPVQRSMADPGIRIASEKLLFPSTEKCLYEWVDNKTVFVCNDIREGLENPMLIYLDTGKRIRLKKLQAMTAEINRPSEFEFTEAYELSPDGKYMLWNRSDGTVHTALLNGTQHRVWSQPENSDLEFSPIARWLSDGHSWVEDDVNTISLRHPELPRGSYVGDLHARGKHGRRLTPEQSQRLIYAKAVLSTDHSYNGMALQAVIVKGRLKQKWIYPTSPLPVETSDVSGSPDRTRLAWILVHRTYSQSGEQQLEEITGEIWITSVDGKKKRCVKALPLNPVKDGHDAPFLIRWLQNGKEVSYLYNGWLYRLKVPAGFYKRR